MLRYREKVRRGKYGLQLLEVNFDNTCNFACEHCFSKFLATDENQLTLEDIHRLAQEAHEIGVWQWHFQGGEPLMWKNLNGLIRAVEPDRFHIMLTTNGYFLTREKAIQLAEEGVDKISVSLDSFKPEIHDRFRKHDGAFDRACKALLNAKAAGMQTNINTVVTRQNVRSDDLLDIIGFAEENGFTVLLLVATACGKWAGRTDMLINDDDARYLWQLKEAHPAVHRDLYPLFDLGHGCRTMNGLVYIRSNGDLFPCPFIHIRIGNVHTTPLAEILARGWRIRYFRDNHTLCLAGEDKAFIGKYLFRINQPNRILDMDQVFGKDDLYPEEPSRTA